MTDVLSPADGIIPALRLVESPGLAAQLNAFEIGSLELICRAIGRMLDGVSSEEDLSLEDFKACLEYIPVFVDDPAMYFVNEHVVHFDTYAEATKWFAGVVKNPEAVPVEVRHHMTMAFHSYLDARHSQDLETFSDRFKGCTVHVSDDSRIAVGRYDQE